MIALPATESFHPARAVGVACGAGSAPGAPSASETAHAGSSAGGDRLSRAFSTATAHASEAAAGGGRGLARPHVPATFFARRKPSFAVAAGVVAGAFATLLYVLTCAPSLEWQDSGMHQYRILTGQVENPLGLALSHPLHHWIGRAVVALVPVDRRIYALNLISAVCGGAAIGLLVGFVAAVTRSVLAVCVAALVTALAHSYWQMSVITETYSLHALLLMVEWLALAWCLRAASAERPVPAGGLIALFAVNGLHISNHLLGLLSLVTYIGLTLVWIARRRCGPGPVLLAAAAWLIAAAPYGWLCVAHYQRGGDALATLHSAFFGGGGAGEDWSQDVLNMRVDSSQFKLSGLTLGYSFPSLALPLALVGALRPLGRRAGALRLVLLAQTLIFFVFVLRYSIKDLYTFFVPLCLFTGLWAGCGALALARGLRRRRRYAAGALVAAVAVIGVATPPLVYGYFPRFAEARGLMKSQLRDLPFRNEYRYFFQPWRSHDDSAEQFAADITHIGGTESWIIGDTTTVFPIASFLLLDEHAGQRRVYWRRTCVFPPGGAPLTDDALRERLRQRAIVIGVPSKEVENTIRGVAVEAPGGHYSAIRLPPRPAATNPATTTAPVAPPAEN